MYRELLWLGSSRADIKAFPVAARRQAGFQLQRVQQGLEPSDWKPVRSVGAGVREIRIRVGTAYRVFYVARERYRDLVATRRRESAHDKG